MMKNKQQRWIVIGLLLFLWGRLLATAVTQSVTFDEIIHILQGTLYWQSWSLYSVVQNPPLLNSLLGLPVGMLFDPVFPFDHPAWEHHDWLTVSKLFMWQFNSVGHQFIFVSRWVIMLLTVLLAAIVYRYAGQLFKRRYAGLLALFLFSFDPNILAHGSLATTDLGITFFITLAVYLVWRYWVQSAGWGLFGLTAVAIGLAFAAKFTAIILIPALYLLVVIRWLRQPHSWPTVLQETLTVTSWLLIGIFIFLLIYRFQWAALIDDFRIQQEHQATGHSSFLHGETQIGGWWYYFPLAFAIKTPLTTLLLLTTAFISALWRRQWRSWEILWLLLPVTAVFSASLISQVNIGYRYLLPTLPLLFIFTGQLGEMIVRQTGRQRRWSQFGLLATAMGLLVASLAIHPHYLAYFNELIGGPENGWRWLVDSNIDWGQDIGALAEYEQENLPEPYWVAWLGTAPLSAYGIERGQPMALWPQGREEPLFDPFYPPLPPAGQYVISVTQLQGVYLQDADRFAWFQSQTPADRIGYSLFVYDVAAVGPTVGVSLSGIGLPMIAPDDYQPVLQTNDVHARWFDARTSFLWAGGDSERVWTAVGDGHLPTHPLLTQFYPPEGPVLTGENEYQGQTWRYHLYEWPESPLRPASTLGLTTAVFADTLQLTGYQSGTRDDQSLDLLTFWKVQRPFDTDLKIFVHVLDETGQLVAQHDGLDVRREGLQAGDQFTQLHTIHLPADLPAGTYTIQTGLYRTDDFTRLTVPIDDIITDHILLQTISLGQ